MESSDYFQIITINQHRGNTLHGVAHVKNILPESQLLPGTVMVQNKK